MMTVDDALNHAQNELESAFEKWLSDECPSGDCESVQRQWDESFVHQELVDELQPVMALTWEVRRLRECLDKANTSAEHFEREWYLRGDEIDRVRAVLTSAQIDCKQWERHYKELREENERLRKDADRYRWLRNKVKKAPASMDGPSHPQLFFEWDFWNKNPETHNADGLDAAIDAARGEK